ncbi:MAG: long-chain-fatty-acid--CoA ligase [Peptococcaceae bacterium]|nr:long-chain-fatty-acid--CoA ligase [Peptococcaceae bacterium]
MEIQEHLSRNFLIGEILAGNSRKYPDKTAFKEGNRSFTYSQYNFRVNKLASAFRELGIGRGDKVAVLLFNSIEVMDCYFALAKLGAVAVPVNFRFVGPEIAYIVDNSDSVALVFDGSFEKVIDAARGEMPRVRHFIAVPGPGETSFALDYNELLDGGSGVEPLVRVEENDPAFIMYTSGTTGRPKGAVLSHKNLYSNVVFNLVERPAGHGEVYLCVPPLFHVAALIMTLQMVFLGATTIIHRTFDPRAVMETVAGEKVTSLFLVPAMWNFLVQIPNLDQYDVSSVKTAITGAAIMPLNLKKRLLQVFPGLQLYDAFGQTEMSPVTTLLKPADTLRKPTSVGRPIVGVEVRVVDSEGNDVPVGEVGEIVYRGPCMLQEYYKNPQATREAIVDGWFHSGDLVRMDEEGFVYVVDRKKDMVISGGENVYPAEVEEVLYRHEKILEAAVIGVPSDKWGEAVHAVVVPKPGQTLTEEEVISFCAANLAGYKKPRSVEFVDALPRNAAGKVLKTRLREKHGTAIKY